MSKRYVPPRSVGACSHGLWCWLPDVELPEDVPQGKYMVFECGMCRELRVWAISLGGNRLHLSFRAFGSASVHPSTPVEFRSFLESLAFMDVPPPRVRYADGLPPVSSSGPRLLRHRRRRAA